MDDEDEMFLELEMGEASYADEERNYHPGVTPPRRGHTNSNTRTKRREPRTQQHATVAEPIDGVLGGRSKGGKGGKGGKATKQKSVGPSELSSDLETTGGDFWERVDTTVATLVDDAKKVIGDSGTNGEADVESG
eukprot:3136729-Rhodomonas_salina.1